MGGERVAEGVRHGPLGETYPADGFEHGALGESPSTVTDLRAGLLA
jgi:hypothetical protein